MMNFVVLSWILLFDAASVVSSSVTGHVGGSVTISCSHWNAGSNVKYFCKDPCTDKDILIKSGQSPTGRYRLENLRSGVFNVTITGLQKSDSGTYWCGVDRFGKDTYNKVILTVIDVQASISPTKTNPPTTSPKTGMTTSPNSSSSSSMTTIITLTSETSFSSPHSSSGSSLPEVTGTLLYTAAGLVAMVLIFGISLIIFCKFKKTRESKISIVYAEVKIPQDNNPQSVSSTPATCGETLDNPIYGAAEDNVVIYSMVQ